MTRDSNAVLGRRRSTLILPEVPSSLNAGIGKVQAQLVILFGSRLSTDSRAVSVRRAGLGQPRSEEAGIKSQPTLRLCEE